MICIKAVALTWLMNFLMMSGKPLLARVAEIIEDPTRRASREQWFSRFIPFFALLVMAAALFAPSTGQSKAAPVFDPDIANASSEAPAVLNAGAPLTWFCGLSCGEHAAGQAASGQAGWCAQHCGSGCSPALAEVGWGVAILRVNSEELSWGGEIVASIDSQLTFRPPRFVR